MAAADEDAFEQAVVGQIWAANLGDYIRWRNQHARPKSGFAINSKIRHPDYPVQGRMTRH
ncbi:hypothetical protein [Micromonospora luteifusca]|uniref:hypothetical protein n=1 Tax=Micromonospora luteifusca TaxID=709860 RepID=UPI003F4B3D9D